MSKKNPQTFRLVRDGQLQVVDTPARAVALEFDGWVRETEPEQANDPGPTATPRPAK